MRCLPWSPVRDQENRLSSKPVLRDLSRSRERAYEESSRGEAPGAAGSKVLPSVSHVQSLPAAGLPADQSRGPQPDEALRHLPQSSRPEASADASKMRGLPWKHRAREGCVSSCPPRMYDLPRDS